MKTIALKPSGFFFFCACLFAAILLNSPKLTAQPFTLNAVNDLDRVFEDGFKQPAIHDTLYISESVERLFRDSVPYRQKKN